jgi:hypothetical protein
MLPDVGDIEPWGGGDRRPLRGGEPMLTECCDEPPSGECQKEEEEEDDAEEEWHCGMMLWTCVLPGDGGLISFLRRCRRFHSSWTHFVNSSLETFGVASRNGDVADGETVEAIAPHLRLLFAVICSGLFGVARRSKL